MAIKLVEPSSQCRVVYYPKTASNVQVENTLLYLTSGKVSSCASAANAAVIAGICLRPVAATDSDYASNTLVPVLVDEAGVWSVPVDDATSFAFGVNCDADSSGQELDCNGSTYIPFTIVGGNTTTGKVTIRRWAHRDLGASVT